MGGGDGGERRRVPVHCAGGGAGGGTETNQLCRASVARRAHGRPRRLCAAAAAPVSAPPHARGRADAADGAVPAWPSTPLPVAHRRAPSAAPPPPPQSGCSAHPPPWEASGDADANSGGEYNPVQAARRGRAASPATCQPAALPPTAPPQKRSKGCVGHPAPGAPPASFRQGQCATAQGRWHLCPPCVGLVTSAPAWEGAANNGRAGCGTAAPDHARRPSDFAGWQRRR